MTINSQNYDIFIELLKKELKVRYKSKVFGYLWSLANPLAHALVYYIVFGLILDNREKNFPLFLITALFPWQWFTNSLGAASMLFFSNQKLVKKVNFDRNLLPIVVVFQDMVHFIVSIPIIFLFMYVYDIGPSLNWFIGLPLLLLLQYIVTYSLTLTIATVNIFFRDTERIIQIILLYLFYFTPILYPVSKIPTQYVNLLYLHPIAPVIVSWRELLIDGVLRWDYIISSFIYSVILYIVSSFIYKKLSWRFAEVL